MRTLRLWLVLLLIPCVSLLLGCGSDSPTGPDAPLPPDESAILLNQLSVAMVPGAVAMISVEATDKLGQPVTCDATCSDANVASIVHSGNVIQVTGVDFGKATITVTSSVGLKKHIPVHIYDHRLLDAGELLISFTDQFSWRWDDRGSGGTYDGNFWHPIPAAGWFALGSFGTAGYYNPSGIRSMMVVKMDIDANPSVPPIAFPDDYVLIYNDAGSGANADGSFWLPVPPSGYKAMGVVAQRGWGKPALTDVVCVREDLTVLGEAGAFVWNDDETGANNDFGSWLIAGPVAGPHPGAYLETGTFVGWNYWHKPISHDAMHVLNVELPMLAEAPYQSYVPRLEGFDNPGDATVPMLAKVMLVPYSIVSDQLYANNPSWRWGNSPFYRLERHVYYKLLYHNHNQTGVEQQNSVEIVSGVTTTESNSFWSETSISVTAEAGISIKFFDAKVSTTVTQSFGYETMTSVSQLQEKHVTSTVTTAPGTAAALWQQFNRYVLKRHNGVNLETVAAWEFGIDSYVTDQFPPAN
jgi:hypothetical protein